ncbi:MAG: hypothetical protein ABEJ56_00300 [Candidatus Nanohaloarchaea archaeon]
MSEDNCLHSEQISDHSENLKTLRDEEPDYSSTGAELIEKFEERLESQVDEEKYLPDVFSVANLALKLGLCIIENTDEDAIELRNRIWLQQGENEKLKESLVEEMKQEMATYDLDNLEELPAEEVYELYSKLNECRE